MIPLEEAQQHVLAACAPNTPVTVTLRDALGCVTAVPVVARESVPSFANTAMDGYAVRSKDTPQPPTRLRVIGELRAGAKPDVSLNEGEAIQIMTGAPLPDGADAIINVEQIKREGDEIIFEVVVGKDQFVRPAGSDVKQGATVLHAGVELRPAHLGVLASIGELTVSVYPRLRVGVLSTGDELVTDGSPLSIGEIRESNKDLLLALVRLANCEPIDLGTVRDDERIIRDALRRGIDECDALITSGGVSMGEYDLVKVVLEQLGTMRWMQIAIQPAKPFAFGLVGDATAPVPIFGLPGNPVSSLVSFELLARPALRKMMGHSQVQRPIVRAIADEGLPRRAGDGKVQWQRVHGTFADDGRLHVRVTGEQGSHQLANSASANALARVPDGTGIGVGKEVDVLLML